MESSPSCVVIAALLLGLVGPLLAASEEPPPEAAVVMITGRHLTGEAGGNGFVIGDGTLVVTCAHMGFEKSARGGHRAPMLLTVFSPYLGDACEAHVVASFLARHRPELRAEALDEARTALRVHDGGAADKAKVEQLIKDLEAKGQ